MLVTLVGSTVNVMVSDTSLPSFAFAVMVTVPSPFAVTNPFLLTVAIVLSEDSQARVLPVAFSGRTFA